MAVCKLGHIPAPPTNHPHFGSVHSILTEGHFRPSPFKERTYSHDSFANISHSNPSVLRASAAVQRIEIRWLTARDPPTHSHTHTRHKYKSHTYVCVLWRQSIVRGEGDVRGVRAVRTTLAVCESCLFIYLIRLEVVRTTDRSRFMSHMCECVGGSALWWVKRHFIPPPTFRPESGTCAIVWLCLSSWAPRRRIMLICVRCTNRDIRCLRCCSSGISHPKMCGRIETWVRMCFSVFLRLCVCFPFTLCN